MEKYIAYAKPSDKKLMKLFLSCPDYVRRVVLSDTQVDVIDMIKDSGEESITTRTLANWRSVSVQSASAQLAKLWYRGYLKRRSVLDSTGGMIYRYKMAI